MPTRQYITTAIDYPNAAPHMGHVLEKVLADVCARWFRLRGDAVRFQIGTDEHGIKIQQAAKAADKDPAEFVATNRQKFIDLYNQLQISYDEPFMHTSGNKQHRKVVQDLWRKLADAGVLEKRTYTALYCTGCERFITKKELVDGKCPDHQIPPQEVSEENWFFTLSKDAKYLEKLLKSTYKIIPEFRAPETLTLLKGGLEDVSFSRPTSSLSWGIPVPDDEEQTMYVWCDALTNYISGLNYFDDAEGREWWDDATITHVIGKDIARFHALIWPAMLHHAGIKTPDQLLIHGFLTSEGQKMSKSLGNVVVPQDVIAKYGVDALRFYLSHEIPVGNDGDFSWKRFGELYDAKLRNQLGNLLNRVLILLKKDGHDFTSTSQSPTNLKKEVEQHWKFFEENMNKFELHAALHLGVMSLIEKGNEWMQFHQPWTKTGEEKLALLTEIAEALRHVALMLLPFIPETAEKISRQLNVRYTGQMTAKNFVISDALKEWGSQKDWKKVGEPSILFAPVE